MSKGITSVEGFVRKVFKIAKAGEETLFYRGHSNRDKYKLQPAIFRTPEERAAEPIMFRELLIANAPDFRDDASTFEKLVRMQHYSLPTRLLDISTNPLVALYFACKSSPDNTGEVIRFAVNHEYIKFFDSDTASCISNLAQLSQNDKVAIDFTKAGTDFNSQEAIRKLLHFIKEEKPYFTDTIIPDDLRRIICIRGKLSNTRIVSQSGAFLIFGLNAELPEEGDDDIKIERLTISAQAKPKILEELDTLALNESTIFPYIENSARYIATKYRPKNKM
ncbi:FRG domain-containing protein [Sagittula salina]|uniref:FRG domain-containing protein n=1 Tax=Sagittula salina TaxID=2820268 RepID=A0A940S423_9RHOB|nr:FRG domain-containing protein [Sagittula salina]MBP0483649.1 FRG domain-containing protein [Sagittula salina]